MGTMNRALWKLNRIVALFDSGHAPIARFLTEEDELLQEYGFINTAPLVREDGEIYMITPTVKGRRSVEAQRRNFAQDVIECSAN